MAKTAGKLPFGIGEYPPEFNPKVHGPYDPARFYGKRKLKLVLASVF
jgi:Mitochondrial F1F0-ATP synthase, subunit f